MKEFPFLGGDKSTSQYFSTARRSFSPRPGGLGGKEENRLLVVAEYTADHFHYTATNLIIRFFHNSLTRSDATRPGGRVRLIDRPSDDRFQGRQQQIRIAEHEVCEEFNSMSGGCCDAHVPRTTDIKNAPRSGGITATHRTP